MQKILSFIPGFRSKKTWKMAIAGLYYLFCFISLTQGLAFFIFMICCPFLIFYLIDFAKQMKNFKKANEGLNEERKSFNDAAARFLLSAVVFALSLAIMGASADKKQQVSKMNADSTPAPTQKATPTPEPTKKPTPTPAPTPTPSPTPQKKAEFKEMEVTKENVQAAIVGIVGNDKLKGVEITQEKGLTIVDVKFNPGTVWDEKMLVRTTATTAVNVMEVLFTNHKVDKVWVWTQTTMIDAKGNEETRDAINVSLTKENAKDINWPKFKQMVAGDYNALFNIADSKYIHPGIQKNLK